MSVAPEAPETGSRLTAALLTVAERVRSMDVLRGVAVLGILLMNITGFASTESSACFSFHCAMSRVEHSSPAAIVLLAIHCFREQLNALDVERVREKAMEADRSTAAGAVLTDEQKDAQGEWTRRLSEAKPEVLNKDLETYRGGYLGILRARAGFVAGMEPNALYHFFFLDAGAMMLLGMALFKLGFFSASLPPRYYWTASIAGFAAGLPVAALAAQHDIASGFDPVTMTFGHVLGAAARMPMAVAHAAIVMLVCQAGVLTWLTTRLAAVGQMAFSNYIAQSLICTTLFYGYGFGLYGHRERYQLYYVVLAVWIVQLIVSPIWLRYFRHGPLEWAWRSLTYMQRQPMRRADAAAPAIPAVS